MMRRGDGLIFFVFLLFPWRISFANKVRCQIQHQNDDVIERRSVNLSSIECTKRGEPYSECVSVHVWIKANELRRKSRIEIQTSNRSDRIFFKRPKKEKDMIKWDNTGTGYRSISRCTTDITSPTNTSTTMWKVDYDCIKISGGETVAVSFTSSSGSHNDSYTAPDPTPEYNLTVDQQARGVHVTVESGPKVYARLCFKLNMYTCSDLSPETFITIDPSQTRTAILNYTSPMPCLCVEVYYTHIDALRKIECPFATASLSEVFQGRVTLYNSSISWSSACPAAVLKPSGSLCWRQHANVCISIPNSTLESFTDAGELKFNIIHVDKHPQTCIQFSFLGGHDVHCPFQQYQPRWEADIRAGGSSLHVYLTSSHGASFSAQLCVPTGGSCVSRGGVHSVRVDDYATERVIRLPFSYLHEEPCVQVWQSNPAQQGGRIICPEYSHKRTGLVAVASLVGVMVLVLLGVLIHKLTKIGVTGWLSIHRPVLLVCSSEQSAQISAVCALASILQGELCAAVRMALWAQTPGKENGGHPGVADLGPLPWLYGQWEAVCKADGKVLIVWSPEAKESYERWREERVELGTEDGKTGKVPAGKSRRGKTGVDSEEHRKSKDRREGKSGKEKCAGTPGELGCSSGEPCLMMQPELMATLTCLKGALQGGSKGRGVALVYFQGLSRSRDIPKTLRGIPRYCLPQDFGGLIQELGGAAGRTRSETLGKRCCTRFLSKTLSHWLARRLAHRLRARLPHTQPRTTQGSQPRPSWERILEESQVELGSPLIESGTMQDQEPRIGKREISTLTLRD